MIKNRIPHWIIIEESRERTTFEGSLQSKMAKINFDHDFSDKLTVKKYINFFNSLKVTSAILGKELTQNIGGELK